MISVLPYVLAGMSILAPGRNHDVLGKAIADRVDAEAPLFADDADKKKTSSWLVAVAYRESSLRLDAVGDRGRSFCAYQIHETAGGTRALLTNADACVGKAFAMLQTSSQVCPAFPLAWYAEGPRGCASPRAQRISNDRMWLAKRIAMVLRSEETP